MFKKIFLVALLGMMSNSSFGDLGQPANSDYVDKSEYNRTLASTRVYVLTLESIYRAYYKPPSLDDLDPSYSKIKYLHERTIRGDKSNNPRYESMYLVGSTSYLNNEGQLRYVVAIEGRGLNEDSSNPDSLIEESCHACFPSIDIFIFVKDQNDNFKLLSRTDDSNPLFTGSSGKSDLDEIKLKEGLVNINEKLKGLVVKSEYFQMGEATSTIEVLALNENKYITSGGRFDFSQNNYGQGGSADGLISFSSKFYFGSILDQHGNYPFIIASAGTHFNKSFKSEPYNVKKTYTFNGSKFVLVNKGKLSLAEQKSIPSN